MSKKIFVPNLHLAQVPVPGPDGPARGASAPAARDEWSRALDSLPRQPLEYCPWPAFPAAPATDFAIAHSNSAILLKFFVEEDKPRITCAEPNDPVYRDSCVEFFLSFDSGRAYYNMEWNAAGVCLMMHGRSKKDRTFLDPALIQTIGFVRDTTAPGTSPGWSLALHIPLAIFLEEKPETLSGLQATANFYKCGDECPEPHYLAWNNIQTPVPDYHQPRFFGELLFL